MSADNAITWLRVENVGPEPVVAKWLPKTFRVAGFAAGSSWIRTRFIASELQAGLIVEAAIDDLRWASHCAGACDLGGFHSILSGKECVAGEEAIQLDQRAPE